MDPNIPVLLLATADTVFANLPRQVCCILTRASFHLLHSDFAGQRHLLPLPKGGFPNKPAKRRRSEGIFQAFDNRRLLKAAKVASHAYADTTTTTKGTDTSTHSSD